MASQLRILGCSGGFGSGLRTTSFLWDQDTLIDAGTGVGDLTNDELLKIDQIFLTHSHLDHIVSIPFLADAISGQRQKPVTVYGLPETLSALHQKIFHDQIWPDFTSIPSSTEPLVRLRAIHAGEAVSLNGRRITSVAVNHAVPAVGYILQSDTGDCLAFSGDTTTCPSFWSTLAQSPRLKHVIVECSFRDAELNLAKLTKHYCPSLLANDLQQVRMTAQIHISHTKPGESETVINELARHAQNTFGVLSQNAILSF